MLNDALARGSARIDLYPMAFIDEGSTAAANAMACAAEDGFGSAYYAGLFANRTLRWSDDQLVELAGVVGAPADPEFGQCVTSQGARRLGGLDQHRRGRAGRDRDADPVPRRPAGGRVEVDAGDARDDDRRRCLTPKDPAMRTLLFIPSPSTSVWEIAGFPLRAYALCIIAGIIAGMIILSRRWRARGGSSDTMELVVAVAVPFGIVGARIYHVITDYQLYFGPGRDPLDALKIWQGGLGVWGAIAFAVFGAWLVARRKQVRLPALLDAAAPGLLVAQAIGRLGNWFNQELFGRPTTLPWGLEIEPRYRPAGYEQFATFHPTFLYEMLWCLAGAVLLVILDRRFRLGHGKVFALYVLVYTAGRFWIEALRIDTVNEIGGFRLNNYTSLILFLAALVWFVWLVRNRPGREEVVEGRGAPGAARARPPPRPDSRGGRHPRPNRSTEAIQRLVNS